MSDRHPFEVDPPREHIDSILDRAEAALTLRRAEHRRLMLRRVLGWTAGGTVVAAAMALGVLRLRFGHQGGIIDDSDLDPVAVGEIGIEIEDFALLALDMNQDFDEKMNDLDLLEALDEEEFS